MLVSSAQFGGTCVRNRRQDLTKNEKKLYTLSSLKKMIVAKSAEHPFHFRRIHKHAVLEILQGFLDDDNSDVCYESLMLFSALVPLLGDEVDIFVPPLVPKIMSCLGHSQKDIRLAAVHLLCVYLKFTTNLQNFLCLFVKHGLESSKEETKRGSLISVSILFDSDFGKENLFVLVESLGKQLMTSAAVSFYAIYFALRKVHQIVGHDQFFEYLNRANADAVPLYNDALSGKIINYIPMSAGDSMDIKAANPNTGMSLAYGILDPKVLADVRCSEDKVRQSGVEYIRTAIRGSWDMKSFEPHLENFLFLLTNLLSDSNVRIRFLSLGILDTIIKRMGCHLGNYLQTVVVALSKNLGCRERKIRQRTISVTHRLMYELHPMPVIRKFLERRCSRNPALKEEIINRITAALLSFPFYDFDLPFLCSKVAPAVTDLIPRVRQAAIECLVVITSIMESSGECESSVGSTVDLLQTACNTDGIMNVIETRVIHHLLPTCTEDGLVQYASVRLGDLETLRRKDSVFISLMKRGHSADGIVTECRDSKHLKQLRSRDASKLIQVLPQKSINLTFNINEGTGENIQRQKEMSSMSFDFQETTDSQSKENAPDWQINLNKEVESQLTIPNVALLNNEMPENAVSSEEMMSKSAVRNESYLTKESYKRKPADCDEALQDSSSCSSQYTIWSSENTMPTNSRLSEWNLMTIDHPEAEEQTLKTHAAEKLDDLCDVNASSQSRECDLSDGEIKLLDAEVTNNLWGNGDYNQKKLYSDSSCNVSQDVRVENQEVGPATAFWGKRSLINPSSPKEDICLKPTISLSASSIAVSTEANSKENPDTSSDTSPEKLDKTFYLPSTSTPVLSPVKTGKENGVFHFCENTSEIPVSTVDHSSLGLINTQQSIHPSHCQLQKCVCNRQLKQEVQSIQSQKSDNSNGQEYDIGINSNELKYEQNEIFQKCSNVTKLQKGKILNNTGHRATVTFSKQKVVNNVGFKNEQNFTKNILNESLNEHKDHVLLNSNNTLKTDASFSKNSNLNGCETKNGSVDKPDNIKTSFTRNQKKSFNRINKKIKVKNSDSNNIKEEQKDVTDGQWKSNTILQITEENELCSAKCTNSVMQCETLNKTCSDYHSDDIASFSDKEERNSDTDDNSYYEKKHNLVKTGKYAWAATFEESVKNMQPFSNREAAVQQMKHLNLLSSDDWQQKTEAMLIVIRIAKFYPDIIEDSLHQIIMTLISEVKNMKPTVSGAAVLSLGYLFLLLKKILEPKFKIVATALLNKSGSRTSAGLYAVVIKSITYMVKGTQPQKAALAFLSNSSRHCSRAVRETSAQFLAILVEKMGAAKCLTGSSILTDSLLNCSAYFVMDGSPLIRYCGKRIFQILMAHNSFTKIALKHVAENVMRNISKILESVRSKGLSKEILPIRFICTIDL